MDPSGQQKSRQQQQQHPAPRRYDGVNGNPLYDPQNGGHYGASANIAANGHAPAPEIFTGPWANVNQGLSGTYRDILNTYWQQQVSKLETDDHDYKLHQLPLARIKKVMKADPEVKMISAEAPILFAKGCDIFITELTMRAWIHAEENKRRTLQRSDIASALAKSDMFDFLSTSYLGRMHRAISVAVEAAQHRHPQAHQLFLRLKCNRQACIRRRTRWEITGWDSTCSKPKTIGSSLLCSRLQFRATLLADTGSPNPKYLIKACTARTPCSRNKCIKGFREGQIQREQGTRTTHTGHMALRKGMKMQRANERITGLSRPPSCRCYA